MLCCSSGDHTGRPAGLELHTLEGWKRGRQLTCPERGGEGSEGVGARICRGYWGWDVQGADCTGAAGGRAGGQDLLRMLSEKSFEGFTKSSGLDDLLAFSGFFGPPLLHLIYFTHGSLKVYFISSSRDEYNNFHSFPTPAKKGNKTEKPVLLSWLGILR